MEEDAKRWKQKVEGRPGAPLPGLKVRRSRPLLHQYFRGAAAIFDARAVPSERGGCV